MESKVKNQDPSMRLGRRKLARKQFSNIVSRGLNLGLLICAFGAVAISNHAVASVLGDEIKAKVTTIVVNQTKPIKDTIAVLPSAQDVQLPQGFADNVLGVIDEIQSVVGKQALAVANFENGSCEAFRGDLRSLMSNLLLTKDSLNGLGQDRIDITLPDFSRLDDFPCKVLYVAYVAFEETPLSEIADRLSRAALSMQVVQPLFIDPNRDLQTDLDQLDVPAFSDELRLAGIADRTDNGVAQLASSELIHTRSCEVIVGTKGRRLAFSSAASAAKAVSIRLQIAAAVLDSEKVSGPKDIFKLLPKVKEVDGGVWGFAHVTLSREPGGHKIAQGLNTVAKIIDGIVDATNSKIDQCITTHNDRILWDKLQNVQADMDTIKAQVCALSRRPVPGCS